MWPAAHVLVLVAPRESQPQARLHGWGLIRCLQFMTAWRSRKAAKLHLPTMSGTQSASTPWYVSISSVHSFSSSWAVACKGVLHLTLAPDSQMSAKEKCKKVLQFAEDVRANVAAESPAQSLRSTPSATGLPPRGALGLPGHIPAGPAPG